jgi:hypothetical protein
LKPIGSDRELRRAIKMVNQLVDRGLENLSASEDAYLDVLSDIVHQYETTKHPMESVLPRTDPVNRAVSMETMRNHERREIMRKSALNSTTPEYRAMMAAKMRLSWLKRKKLGPA